MAPLNKMNDLPPSYIICSSNYEHDDHSKSTHSSCYDEDISHDSTTSSYPKSSVLRTTRTRLSQDSDYFITGSIRQKGSIGKARKPIGLSHIIIFAGFFSICLLLGSFVVVLIGFLTIYEFSTKLIAPAPKQDHVDLSRFLQDFKRHNTGRPYLLGADVKSQNT